MTHGRPSPAFLLYVNDWLGSTKIALMSPAEEGAFIRLLCHCWNDPDCTLPDGDEALAVLSRLGNEWFKGSAIKLRACFVPHPKKPGRLFNVRLMKDWKKMKAFRRDKSRAGRKGAESRWNPSAEPRWHSHASAIALPMANTMANDGLSSSSSLSSSLSSPSPKEEKKEYVYAHSSSSKKTDKTVQTAALNGHAKHAWSESFERFWAVYPKRRNKGDAEKWFATHRPAPDLIEQMLTKIAELKTTDAWQDHNGKFVPYPFNWLDAKGWQDQVRVDLPHKKPRLAL